MSCRSLAVHPAPMGAGFRRLGLATSPAETFGARLIGIAAADPADFSLAGSGLLDVYSAHADANGLVRWAQARQPIKGHIFVAHGEPQASKGLADRLEQAGFDPTTVVRLELDECFELTPTKANRLATPPAGLAPGRAATLDWHNARADLLSRLSARIEDASSEADRRLRLQALEDALTSVQFTDAAGRDDEGEATVSPGAGIRST